jgi:RNA polymerase sigma-70 factor (ECF subfamily)
MPSCPKTQAEVVDLFLEQGTEDAFAPLCHLITPRLLNYFLVRRMDAAAAEDLTQDVLFTIYRQARHIRERQLFDAWMFKVARNALLQRMRKNSRQISTVSLEDLSPAVDRVVIDGSPFARLELAGLLASLSPRDREIVTLRFIDGLQYEAIAAVLDIPEGTAKWRVFHVRAKLAQQTASRVSAGIGSRIPLASPAV